MEQKKLAVSLSGGGARAFCYLGFIRALEKNNISIDYVVAQSGAAILMCFLASGKSDEEIIDAYSKLRYWHFVTLGALAKASLYSNEKMINYLDKFCNGKQIEDMHYKTFITITDVTDFDHPFAVLQDHGNLAKYATISGIVPPAFAIYKDNDRLYADGGYCSLYSARFLREQRADVVIGLYPDGLKMTKLPFFAENFARVVKSINSAREEYERKEQPVDMEVRGFNTDAGLSDFQKADAMYKAGYQKAMDLMPRIKQLIY